MLFAGAVVPGVFEAHARRRGRLHVALRCDWMDAVADGGLPRSDPERVRDAADFATGVSITAEPRFIGNCGECRVGIYDGQPFRWFYDVIKECRYDGVPPVSYRPNGHYLYCGACEAGHTPKIETVWVP